MAYYAISGKARSGKDTFGKMLAEEISKVEGKPYVLMAYATELKKRVQKDFDLSWEQLWGEEKEVEDRRYPKQDESGFWTAREILQACGQFYRTIHNDFWVESLFRIIDEKEYENVIITDVRHANEVDAVVNRGGFHIRIIRDAADSIHGSDHISETALDNGYKVDVTIENNSNDLETLRKSAHEVAVFLTSRKGANKILEV